MHAQRSRAPAPAARQQLRILLAVLEPGSSVMNRGAWRDLEQGEKRDVFIMNGAVFIPSMYFVLFLWFTY